MAPSDIRSGRLSASQYADNFADAHPPLTPMQARIGGLLLSAHSSQARFISFFCAMSAM